MVHKKFYLWSELTAVHEVMVADDGSASKVLANECFVETQKVAVVDLRGITTPEITDATLRIYQGHVALTGTVQLERPVTMLSAGRALASEAKVGAVDPQMNFADRGSKVDVSCRSFLIIQIPMLDVSFCPSLQCLSNKGYFVHDAVVRKGVAKVKVPRKGLVANRHQILVQGQIHHI